MEKILMMIPSNMSCNSKYQTQMWRNKSTSHKLNICRVTKPVLQTIRHWVTVHEMHTPFHFIFILHFLLVNLCQLQRLCSFKWEERVIKTDGLRGCERKMSWSVWGCYCSITLEWQRKITKSLKWDMNRCPEYYVETYKIQLLSTL